MSQKICKTCVMDTTVPGIEFDEDGRCNYCQLHDTLEGKFPDGEEGEKHLAGIINRIKERGKNKKYDCVVGISGGVDSTYLAYMSLKWGLRPLAVHLDNGWNSDKAIHNIEAVSTKLGLNLRVEKVDWEEFKQLQMAFLAASVSDIEGPTDIGIYGTLYKVAAEEGIPSLLNGHSFRQEGTVPIPWTYLDGRYIDHVYRKATGKNLLHFNNIRIKDMLYYSILKGIKTYRPLEYLDYEKEKAARILESAIGWQDYGGHHFESVYTRFISSYVLPHKFNIDKRKVTLSAQVRSGKMSRDEALSLLEKNCYSRDIREKDEELVLMKLGLSENEFERIMALPIRTHDDYKTYLSIIRRLRIFIQIACRLKLVPEILYEKYAKNEN